VDRVGRARRCGCRRRGYAWTPQRWCRSGSGGT
jgi:hypothetical protein